MQYDPKKSVKIPIESLAVGMFVTSIEDGKRINLANAGRISSKKAINQLVKSGIQFAWVDKSLSAKGCVFNPTKTVAVQPTKPQIAESEHQSEPVKCKKVSRFSQQKKAAKIISEAKGFVHKILSQTFDGKAINVGDLDTLADDMIETLLLDSDAVRCVSALRNKNQYLLEHSINVATLMVTFGKHLNMPKEVLKQLAIGGIIHDVGKVKVDDKVLNKPARLTPEEFEHMKLHQVYAEAMVSNVVGISQVSLDVCLMHHEKLDGSGYPIGLKGDDISLHGRMSSIVDIYDALTSDRCYKQGMSSAEAFKILISLTPHQLDKQLVYKFINCVGIFPVGSIVELSDGRVGIVWSSNQIEPLKPEVKCFYSRKYKRFVDVSFINLKTSNLTITKGIALNQLEVDAKPFFEV
ncbi:HD family phosphohydrolase [Vibrio tubiashii]|nr:HD family phosphohydrolase [Vibrio tubiashii]